MSVDENRSISTEFESTTAVHSTSTRQDAPLTSTIGNVVLQHSTLDLSLCDLQPDPIITSHAELGKHLLLESATFGTISIVTTPTIEYSNRGTPTIFVKVHSEGPLGQGLGDLRSFWATVADQAAPAFATVLGTAIERAIGLTAMLTDDDAAQSVD